jgi:hypothetical protein
VVHFGSLKGLSRVLDGLWGGSLGPTVCRLVNEMVKNEMVKNEMVKNEMVKNVDIFCNITQSLLMLRFVDITIFRGAGHQQRLHDKLTRRHGNLNVD